MATIDELKPEQLKNPEIREKIKELADDFIIHVQAQEAFALQEKLASILDSSDLKNLQPELYNEYQNLLVKLKWTASSIIPEGEFLKLIKEDYLLALGDENIDAQDRIEIKMFSVDLFPRNELRQKIYKAVKENEEKLGVRTIKEWINDYSQSFDFQERTKTTHLDYLSQNPGVRSLSEKEKDILRKILWTLDSLLIVTPVMSEPLFSEAYKIIAGIGIIRKPIPFPTPPATLPAPEIKKEIRPIPLEVTEKPEKAGLLKKLFGKKPKKPEFKPSVYEKRISPYEKKRRFSSIMSTLNRPIATIDIPHPKPPKAEEIQTFSGVETKPEKKEAEKTSEAKPKSAPAMPQYQIRTMKQDIEKAGKQPLPPKPTPKVKDNVVDLSGK